MNKLFEALDAVRPVRPGSRYAMGYDDGIAKAKSIIKKLGFVSTEHHRAVVREKDRALAYIESHGLALGNKTPDVERVVRCLKCRWYDPRHGYCQFWHGIRPASHYCREGETLHEG